MNAKPIITTAVTIGLLLVSLAVSVTLHGQASHDSRSWERRCVQDWNSVRCNDFRHFGPGAEQASMPVYRIQAPAQRPQRDWQRICMEDWNSARCNDFRHFGPPSE